MKQYCGMILGALAILMVSVMSASAAPSPSTHSSISRSPESEHHPSGILNKMPVHQEEASAEIMMETDDDQSVFSRLEESGLNYDEYLDKQNDLERARRATSAKGISMIASLMLPLTNEISFSAVARAIESSMFTLSQTGDAFNLITKYIPGGDIFAIRKFAYLCVIWFSAVSLVFASAVYISQRFPQWLAASQY
eukprot:Nk52_evm16s305 gene=Nk52_evmTU16s305